MPHLAAFILFLFHFMCNSYHRLHPSSIWWDSNPLALGREPSVLTTKPGKAFIESENEYKPPYKRLVTKKETSHQKTFKPKNIQIKLRKKFSICVVHFVVKRKNKELPTNYPLKLFFCSLLKKY